MPEGNDSYRDMYEPYSSETNGDLLEYLISCDEGYADNRFRGPEYFFEMINLGLIHPDITIVRVDQSPAPDKLYFVNANNKLQSNGLGRI